MPPKNGIDCFPPFLPQQDFLFITAHPQTTRTTCTPLLWAESAAGTVTTRWSSHIEGTPGTSCRSDSISLAPLWKSSAPAEPQHFSASKEHTEKAFKGVEAYFVPGFFLSSLALLLFPLVVSYFPIQENKNNLCRLKG